MKKLSSKAIKGILISSGTALVAGTCAIAVIVNTSMNAKGKISLVENGVVETQKPKVLLEAEKEVNESKAQVAEANKELDQATEAKEAANKDVTAAEEAFNKAEENRKAAEEEVKKATTAEARKAAEAKVKAAQDAVTKAQAAKDDAVAKAKKAEEALAKAQDNIKAAEERVQKAEDNKKAVEEELKKSQSESEANVQNTANEQTKKEPEEPTQKPALETNQKTETETKKETTPEVSKKTTTTTMTTSQKTTENKTQNNTQSNTQNNTQNNTVTNPSTGSNRSLTDEQLQRVLEAAKKGEEADREQYIKDYTEKYGHAPEEEKTEVEFHFYNTVNPITVRLYDHEGYYTASRCGETGSGCIWFAEFTCDLNQCVGFPDSSSKELKGDVVYSLRADKKEYTMNAPEARPGYKFKQWELISDRKNTLYGQTGIAYKYVAIYEKA